MLLCQNSDLLLLSRTWDLEMFWTLILRVKWIPHNTVAIFWLPQKLGQCFVHFTTKDPLCFFIKIDVSEWLLLILLIQDLGQVISNNIREHLQTYTMCLWFQRIEYLWNSAAGSNQRFTRCSRSPFPRANMLVWTVYGWPDRFPKNSKSNSSRVSLVLEFNCNQWSKNPTIHLWDNKWRQVSNNA